MIRQNDLRVGNEFQFLTSEGWERNIIDAEDITMCVYHNGHFNTTYRPIPLTEDILLKCGFVKPSNETHLSLYLDEIDKNESLTQRIDYWFNHDAELCRSGICFKRVKLNYLHQLQNLYFALTQKELTVQL